ncbi:hypothetical protein F4561_000322 [Lipingzhangella halophila]|uniref:Uncharacterized protein n=1 Tax=Lipingzhangella halophila TaxID=1783352 RepID=A0A7W7W038_9ACTN|nr:DUF6069 family protein [Lipingzhangella halophila]MBB4929502.1 hypothetical protein [Lipingzhangella halophila]
MNEYGGGRQLNIARLWSGGLATAVVAGLVILVGALVVRGILGIPVLAPEEAGYFGDAGTGVYAVLAALAALAATGLLHLLLISAPRPRTFFGWIVGLGTTVAVVSPFAQVASVPSQIATALINLVAGIAIATLLNSVAAGALARRARRPADTSDARDDENPRGTGYHSGYRDALNGYPTRHYGGRHRSYDPNAQTRIDWN